MGADGGVHLYNVHKIEAKYTEEKLRTILSHLFWAKPEIVGLNIQDVLDPELLNKSNLSNEYIHFLSLSYGTNIPLDIQTDDIKHVMEETDCQTIEEGQEVLEFLLWINKETFLNSWETWT